MNVMENLMEIEEEIEEGFIFCIVDNLLFVTEKWSWEEEQLLQDEYFVQTKIALNGLLGSLGLGELQESTYELSRYDVTLNEIRKRLEEIPGFEYNQDFETFMKS